ncbi:brachyurin-like [Macrobrachium nipponense]|uniref:brachyurin-like n=1 Tax=Macrobrachium nipponense TaxID=159736 RepID=UPI0030C7C47B
MFRGMLLVLLCALVSATHQPQALTPQVKPGGSHSNVIGGTEVTPHSHPYVVHIDAWGVCQGFLLSDEWVVTIAQCIAPAEEAVLTFGAHNIYEHEPEQVKFYSSEFIVHEEFSPTDFLNDIALIKLQQPILFTPAIQPAELPTYSIQNGSRAILTGWGQTSESDPYYSDVLREGKVTISHDKECEDYYGLTYPHTICVMTGHGSAPFCQGDFGSTLYFQGMVHGIASFYSAAGCDSDGGDVYNSHLRLRGLD